MPNVVVKTIGSAGGRDYSTIATWIAACPADLVAADQVYRGEMYNDSEFVVAAQQTIGSGVTTDATRYIELTVAAGQSFVDHPDARTNPLRYDASKGVAVTCSTSYTAVFQLAAQYTRISRLQIRHSSTAGGANNGITSQGLTTSNCTADSCLLSWNGAGNAYDSGKNEVVKNCIFIATRTGLSQGICRFYDTVTVTNCLFVAPTDVATKPNAAVQTSFWLAATFKNCGFFGSTLVASSTTNGTFTNCYTDVASPPAGCTTVAYDTSTGSGFFAATLAYHDFRLKRTSALIGAGTNSGAPATDISGLARPQGTNVDVGPWEVFIDPGPKYRPFGDIGQPQWVSPSGWKRWEALDETTASDSDYVFADVGSQPYVAEIGPLAADTYTTRVRASVASGNGTLTIRLLDASLAVLATSSPQTVTSTPTTFEPALTFASGTAYYISMEIAA